MTENKIKKRKDKRRGTENKWLRQNQCKIYDRKVEVYKNNIAQIV